MESSSVIVAARESGEELPRSGAMLANFTLAVAGAVCFSALVYFLYHYAWIKERQFSSNLGPIVYYGLPAILTVGFLISLRLRLTYRINVALICAAVMSSLYAGEIALRAFEYVSLRRASSRPAGFDHRNKLEVIADLRRSGADPVLALHPPIFISKLPDGTPTWGMNPTRNGYFPLGGIANKITVHCNESGQYSIYKSDEHGFNNPTGIWDRNRIDIAAVGDSFANGACVPADKNFLALIRKHYPGTLNLGIRGFGPLSELAVLKEYLSPVKPKVVLWFYFENDLTDLDVEKRNPILMAYLQTGFTQGLVHVQKEIDQALTEFIKKEETEYLARRQVSQEQGLQRTIGQLIGVMQLGALRQRLGIVYGRQTGEAATDFEPPLPDTALFQTILADAQGTVGAWGGKLYFVFLPEWERYGQPGTAHRHRDPVLKITRDLHIPLIDLHPVFEATGDPLSLFPFRRFGHYNERGNQLVAETVLTSILQTPSSTP
jgi:hypothetical protein